MSVKNVFAFYCLLLYAIGTFAGDSISSDYPIQGVPFSRVTLNDKFWTPRIQQNRNVTIPIALQQCETTGRVDNFKKAAAILQGKNIGYFGTDYTFDDTDIYKILEGMAYQYATHPANDLKQKMDDYIAIVGAAQESDGYLMTARTAGKPGALHAWLGAQRWEKDPELSHELYNSGHLFEAAAAHYEATGDTSLLHIATKNADLLVEKFLKGGLTYEPGHQIVEMGLVKLYRVTGKKDYLDLAKYFLDIRGKYPSSQKTEYCQSHLPVVEQTEAVGHAVRAVYMYSGMADVAAMTGQKDYLNAIDRIWENVVQKKYYITGGIGARHSGEAFGENYELPNETAYNETCAAIGNVYWNWRMFLLHGDSKYYDVLERTLYNGVLSGISLSGDHFFYPNPLQSSGGYGRSEWFGCACCPSNLCRFMASVPNYIYAHKDNRIYVNLFVGGQADVTLGNGKTIRLTQKTGYPWEGDVALTINNAADGQFQLAIRIPGWACNQPVPSSLYSYINSDTTHLTINVNGVPIIYSIQQGYAVINRKWEAGDVVSMTLPMKVHRVEASELVTEDKGKVALERGPIVYCLEWCDNDGRVLSSVVSDDAAISVEDDSVTFKGTPIKKLKIAGLCMTYDENDHKIATPMTLTAIPYFAWDNRGTDGEMAVWLARMEDGANVARDKVARTDTIDCDLGQVPTKQSYTSGYPAVSFPIDRMRVANSLGISESQLSSLFGSYITFAAIEPNGKINASSTAVAPGQWFNSKGKVVAWCSPSATTNVEDQSIVFSEYKKATSTFLIGQYPQLCNEGDEYTWQQALTYVPREGVPARVLFRFHLHVCNARTAYEYALAYARSLLNSPLYAYVTGSSRTVLQAAVAMSPATDEAYQSATTELYTAATTFVNVSKEQNVSSQYLVNPSFESGTKGWTITLNGTGDQNIDTETGHATDGDYYSGFWRAGLVSADYHQSVTLPSGQYRMSVDVEYSCNNDPLCRWSTAQPYFGSLQSTPQSFDSSMSGKGAWQTFSLEFSLNQTTTADLGVLLIPEAGGTWGHIDNFRLVRTGDGVATDVKCAVDKSWSRPSKVYDLSGRRIPQGHRPFGGLYIKEGRIFMAK